MDNLYIIGSYYDEKYFSYQNCQKFPKFCEKLIAF